MRKILTVVLAASWAGSILFAPAACSSPATVPAAVDAPAAETSANADAAPSGPCTGATARVAEDDAGVCCPGLFKACVGGSFGDISPCICSTIECGTEAEQPPPNVPCCFDPSAPIASNCVTSQNGETTCTCGNGDR